jgi:catechol O-methyltransferase
MHIGPATDLQHLLDVHPNSIYPGDWTSDTNEDRAGYITLEKSDVYAATAQGAFDLAGLHKVLKVSLSRERGKRPVADCQIVVGSSTTSLKSLRETLNMPRPLQFDMVFLDHLKPLYTIDLKVMEEEGLVGPVSSCPDFLPFHSSSPCPSTPYTSSAGCFVSTSLDWAS